MHPKYKGIGGMRYVPNLRTDALPFKVPKL